MNILNETAESYPRISPRKRGRTTNDGTTSPSKRHVVEARQNAIPQAIGSNVSAPGSGRLRAVAKASRGAVVSNRDIFEYPEDPPAAKTVDPHEGHERTKKLRALKAQKQPQRSPLKGKGVIETNSTARVDLDDSPAKNTRSRARTQPDLSKIKKSLQSGRVRDKREAQNGTLNGLVGEGDIFAAAHRQVSELPQGHKIHNSEEAGDESASPSRQLQTELTQTSKKSRKRASQVTDQKDAHVLEGADPAEGDWPKHSEDGPPQSSHRATPVPTRPSSDGRHETEAKRRARDQAGMENDERREKQVEKALEGITEAVELLDCRDVWIDMIVAAAEIRRLRASADDDLSTKGKRALEALNRVKKAYKECGNATGQDPPPSQDKSLQEHLVQLDRECQLLEAEGFKAKADRGQKRERSRQICDIYQHIIPGLVRLSGQALKVRYRPHGLSPRAYAELAQLLAITADLTDSACFRWQPRPDLATGIKQRTRRCIGPNVKILGARYTAELERLTTPVEDKSCLDRLEEKQRRDWHQLVSAVQEKRARIRERHRPPLATPSMTPPEPGRREDLHTAAGGRHHFHTVIDVDELDLDDQRSSLDGEIPAAGASTHTEHRSGLTRERPSLVRESTEEIPGPLFTHWSEEEICALLNGLQMYTGETRFEDILDEYGGTGEVLNGRDRNELMLEARFIKHSMAEQLRDGLDDSWQWLRSVPDSVEGV